MKGLSFLDEMLAPRRAAPYASASVFRIVFVTCVLLACFFLPKDSGLERWGLKELAEFCQNIHRSLDLSVCKIGKAQLSLWTVVYCTTALWFLTRATGSLQRFISAKVLAKANLDRGTQHAIGTGIRYVVTFIGLSVILQSAGVNIGALTILAGAMGVGISFGLQAITNNLVSGIIILFERHLKVGDRIQVGDVTGNVLNISLRATTILTNENISVVVPNSQFVTSNVINWSHTDRVVAVRCQFQFPLSIDPERVKSILIDVATLHKGVLKDPMPELTLDEFGEEFFKYTLWLWTSEHLDSPERLKSEINFEVSKFLRDLCVQDRQGRQSEAALPFYPIAALDLESPSGQRRAGRELSSPSGSRRGAG